MGTSGERLNPMRFDDDDLKAAAAAPIKSYTFEESTMWPTKEGGDEEEKARSKKKG